MDYLKISRQASEGRRAARLSRGLSCFVDGSSTFVDSVDPSWAESSAPMESTPASSKSRASPSAASRNSSFDVCCGRSLSTGERSFSSVSDGKLGTGTSSDLTTPLPDWWAGNNRKEIPPDDSHSNQWAFRRAANLLRESLELEGDGGVIFLEAKNSPSPDPENTNFYSSENNNPAHVLAISTNDEPFAPKLGSTVSCPAANIDQAFLNQLIRRYPKGKLWSFHRDGTISTSDEDEKPGETTDTKPINVGKGSTKKYRASENSMLNAYFHHANQVLFVPLWNAASSQWYAGCFCWTTQETRVFSSAVELSSVTGFASSIMAECSRVESLIADRQKGDFIGSISHELRSPLHGILAAAELLDGTSLSGFQESLLETINACGRTLLDTMNQVLDFSKIMSLERTWRQLKRNKELPLELKGTDKISAHLDTYVAVDLSILAEEVVEGVCLGHAYGQKSNASTDQPVILHHASRDTSKVSTTSRDVEVVIDIASQDWVYQTQPGALRRIIMNVFGNAMKYTEKGRIIVRLEATERSEGRSRRQGLEDLVTLTISDTGKGISEGFLRGRLYTPFAQEDTLAVGTGLGLSIVRSIVKALDGSISIHSRPGEGTVVKVSLPLQRPVGEERESPPLTPHADLLEQGYASLHSQLLRDGYEGGRAAIWGVDLENLSHRPFWSAVTHYLRDWYGLDLVSWPSQDPIDILIADENDLNADAKSQMSSTLPALLVFCNKPVDYRTARSDWSSLATTVDIVRQPCGPHKLAKSILKCLQGNPPPIPTINAQTELPERPRIGTMPAADPLPSPDMSDLASPEVRLVPVASAQFSMQSSNPSDDASAAMRSSAPTPPSSTTSRDVDPPSRLPRKPRVLVVDDNSINLSLMLMFVKKRNLVALDSAENGKLAVEAVERMKQGYDLIFMDMSMPVMNGFEATRAIRALEKERDGCEPAIIIALTGLSSSRDESEALASGVDLFLTKPVSFKEVSRLLDEWEAKQAERA